MNSKHDIGETVFLKATINEIKQVSSGQIVYKVKELPDIYLTDDDFLETGADTINNKHEKDTLQRIVDTLERIESPLKGMGEIDLIRIADLLEEKLSREVERKTVVEDNDPLILKISHQYERVPHHKQPDTSEKNPR